MIYSNKLTTLAFTVCLQSLATSSTAEELLDPARFTWTGVYIGVVAGTSFGTNKFEERGQRAEALPGDWRGPYGGLTIGYDYDFGNSLVLGAEADYTFGRVHAIGSDNFINPPVLNCGGFCVTDLENLATVRGRVGYASEQLLLFATGGYASANANANRPFFNRNGTDARLHGYVWGAGLEWAFDANWSAKFEYLHADLGRLEIDAAVCTTNCFTDVVYETIRLGLNYRF